MRKVSKLQTATAVLGSEPLLQGGAVISFGNRKVSASLAVVHLLDNDPSKFTAHAVSGI